MSFLTTFLKKALGKEETAPQAEESTTEETTEEAATEEESTTEETTEEAATEEESTPEETTEEAATEEESTPAPAEAAQPQADPRAEFSRMAEAFGPEFAGIAFAKGLDYAAANDLYTQGLKAENDSLKSRLAALGAQGEEPVAASAVGGDDKPVSKGGMSAFRAKAQAALAGKK